MENNHIIIKSTDPNKTDNINFLRVEEFGNVALHAVQRTEPEAIEFLKNKGYKDIKYITDAETDSVVIVAGNGKDIVVSVRGKDSQKDDYTVGIRGYIVDTKTDSAIGGRVGFGYLDALNKNNKQLLAKISSAIQELDNQYEGKANINFASHSMGGAISSVMLAEIKARPDEYPFSKNIKTILTFASLPPGNDEFRKKYKEMCEKHQIECVEITNKNDLSFVTPPPHRYSVNRQIIINENGKVTIDPSLIEKIGIGSHSDAHNEKNILDRIRQLATEQGITGGKDMPDGNPVGNGSGNRANNIQR